MRDVLGPGTVLGYCTNVHAGTTPDEIKANLDRYATRVRERVAPDGRLGVGLWLPASAARALRDGGAARDLAGWLETRGLEAFTINGFPYGDFHRDVVKHDVYRPHWADPARLAYTLDLMHVLADLVPRGGEGSISTLPIGWRADFADGSAVRAAAEHLRAAAAAAARIEDETGTLVHLDLEPEPGCLLDRAADVVALFERHLLGGGDERLVRRHLRVCHDVCHAAVMFEDQAEMLGRYDEAGVAVGKVQISSAVRVPFDAMPPGERRAARGELAAFREERYLHQTTVRETGGRVTFHEDLPAAIAAVPPGAAPAGEWRVHFHVPVFLERFGRLETTRDEIGRALALFAEAPGVRHFEIETYAWDVLPPELRADDLAEGVAREVAWVGGAARGKIRT